MFEYAISCGEGTLLDYGIGDEYRIKSLCGLNAYIEYEDCIVFDFNDLPQGETFMFSPASPDCQTGK